MDLVEYQGWEEDQKWSIAYVTQPFMDRIQYLGLEVAYKRHENHRGIDAVIRNSFRSADLEGHGKARVPGIHEKLSQSLGLVWYRMV
jgi:hypothetical protein